MTCCWPRPSLFAPSAKARCASTSPRHIGGQATWTTRPTWQHCPGRNPPPGWRHVHGALSSRSGSTGQPADRCASSTTCSTSTATGARSSSSAELDTRTSRTPPDVDTERLRAALDRFFPDPPPDLQRLAVAACVTGWVTVIAGGPGTGKTTTVARLLAVLSTTLDAPRRLALAAPTGKAAARMQEAVSEEFVRLAGEGVEVPTAPQASTLHRLLGWRPDSHSRFRFNRHNHLPYDLVVIDETSMVSLTLMSRLLEALRPDTQLVLVGDPDQLASVEAGAVLGDLVRRRSRPAVGDRSDRLIDLLPADVQPADEVESELRKDVVRLRTVHRYGSAIAELAEAIRRGRADDAVEVLRRGSPEVEFVETDLDARRPASLEGLRADVVDSGRALIEAALAGDGFAALQAMDRHRLLCAHRRGTYGVARWSQQVESWLGSAVDRFAPDREWYIGRPLIITANDYELGLFNGDTGVVIDRGASGPTAVFTRGTDVLEVAPNRLDSVQTVHALTVHRAQGSQFARVSVLVPPPSPHCSRANSSTPQSHALAVRASSWPRSICPRRSRSPSRPRKRPA